MNTVKWALAGAALAVAGVYVPSQYALQSIKASEGVRTTAYLDAVHIPTICYGSTSGVRLGDVATLAECDTLLMRDATYAGAGVARQVTARITQGQYDALTSFVYNIGEPQFKRSTLLRKLNAGDCYGAARQFDLWVYAKGKRLNGLVARRASERYKFEQGCIQW